MKANSYVRDTDPLENPSRRSFLRFGASQDRTVARRAFSRVEFSGDSGSSVIWSAESLDDGSVIFAGDDGLILSYASGECVRQETITDLPIHSICNGGGGSIFAVGWLGLIIELSENKWRFVQGGKPAGPADTREITRRNLPLFDVASGPDGTIWAVGDQGRVTRRKHGDWEELDCGVTANLRCVLPLENGSILVGGLGGTALCFDGEKWESIQTNTSSPIVSLALNGDEVCAVGGDFTAGSNRFVGHVFRYSHGRWEELDTGGQLPRLRRIRNHKGTLLIVGDAGAAFRIEDGVITVLETEVFYDLHDVAVSAVGELLLCGDGNTVVVDSPLTGDGQGHASEQVKAEQNYWRVINQDLTRTILRGVWAAPDNSLFAVGDGGTILSFSEGNWILHESCTDVRLHGVWGTSESDVYAVGDSSTVLHFDGIQWTVCYRGEVDVALLAITGYGSNDILVVGDNGFALRFNGIHWQRVETGTQHELYAVWGLDSNHILAVGGAGTVVRWNGEAWRSFSTGIDQDLYAVWGSSLTKVHLCGLASTIIQFQGEGWDKEYCGVRFDIHAISGSADGKLFAVGSQGIALRNEAERWYPEKTGIEDTLRAIASTDKKIFAVGSNGCVVEREIK